MDWAELETSLRQEPLFFVQKPDGRRQWSELDRVSEFQRLVHLLGPKCAITPIPNAGKRSRFQARKEGIVAGAFDYEVTWPNRGIAWPEFKGYDARGQAGKLSDAQIEWGNRKYLQGHDVACFFCPIAAVDWLRALGAPLREVRAA